MKKSANRRGKNKAPLRANPVKKRRVVAPLRAATGATRRGDSNDKPTSGVKRRLKQLAQDLAVAGTTARTITHDEFEELLPWYSSAERDGNPVNEIYPDAWSHLQTCERCSRSLELMRIALEPDLDTNAAQVPTSRPTLPFLSDESFMTWRQEASSLLLGKRPIVSFRFNPAHLEKLLRPSRARGTGGARDGQFVLVRDGAERSSGDFPSEALLLADEMSLGELNLAVQAWIVPTSPQSEHVSIFLQVVQTVPVKRGVSVRLLWGDEEYQAPLKDGRGVFADLTPPTLVGSPAESSPEFRLSFELTDDAAQVQDSSR